jgi:transcription initiation factor IIE alpha subunit
MLSHPTLAGWKKCPTCNFCIDKKGQNELIKELQKQLEELQKQEEATDDKDE